MRNNMQRIVFVFATVGIIAASAMVMPVSAVINYEAEIKKLQTQNAANINNKAVLETSALTLEQKIDRLRDAIASLDLQIRTNEASRAAVTIQIADNDHKISKAQTTLGEIVRQLYMDNELTMIEKMAASQNLSDFVDQEEYSMLMQEKIQSSLQEINILKKEHEHQKILVEQLISRNKIMQTQLELENQELNRLLSLNQQEQLAYNQSIAATNTQITDLQREQAEENLRFQREQEALAETARLKTA